MNSIGNLFDRVDEGLDKSWNKAFNVLVRNQSGSFCQ